MKTNNSYFLEEYASLRDELLNVLDEWYNLFFVKKKEIEFKYENIFGAIEDEIEIKTKNATKLQRKVELLCTEMKKGERLSKNILEKVNLIVKNEDSSTLNNTNCFGSVSAKSDKNRVYNNYSQEKVDINKVYRNIVKILHPDVIGEDAQKAKYWLCVQAAYKEKDGEKLNLYHKTLCNNYVEEYIKNDKINLLLAELQINIVSEKRKLEQIKLQEPFVYENKLNDRLWLFKRRNSLYRKLDKIEKTIHFNRNIIKNITANIAM